MHATLARTALRVATEELRSALRDRQTVLYSIVLPLVLYPALFWVLIQGFTVLRGRDEVTPVRVLVAGELPGVGEERLFEALAEAPEGGGEVGPVQCERADADLDADLAAERLRQEGGIDLVLLLGRTPATLLFDGTRSRSNLARDRVSGRLRALAASVREEELVAAGHEPRALAAFDLERHDLASERDLAAYLFSFILPMTFVVMAVMGAFYPAVDATAGEKERGTAETTLLLPVGRLAVQLGKVLAVAAAALVATVLNLAGLVLAAEPLLAGLGEEMAIEIPWERLLFALPLSAAFLVTTSAVLVAVASLTDTFKQGQALLGAVQMVFILPAVFAIMPGIELDATLAFVPIVQTVLAFKTVLQGAEGRELLLAIVFGSQLVYAALALFASMHLTSREALLVSGTSLRRVLRIFGTQGAPR